MPYSDLDRDRWWSLADGEARLLAERVARSVGVELVAVRPPDIAGRPGRTALFRHQGALYALVPGGEADLGHDGGSFTPHPAQLASYAESAEEYVLPHDIHAHIDAMTSPPRTAVLRPLLVAVDAIEAGAVSVPAEHPAIVELVAQARRQPWFGQPGQLEWSGTARVSFGADGQVGSSWLLDVPSYADELRRLAVYGQRLLTPDEWEHACGAGARTLFRWGDYTPSDRYPLADDDVPHRTPNTFGLLITQDPHREERTADPAVSCGGDGGSMLCGRAGFFLGWLTLATAYRDVEHAAWLAENTGDVNRILVRPVIPLQ